MSVASETVETKLNRMDDDDVDDATTLREQLAAEKQRTTELKTKLKAAVTKGKHIERERAELVKKLEAMETEALTETRLRTEDAAEAFEEDADGGPVETRAMHLKRVETKLAVLEAELEAYRAENGNLRERLENAEASSDEEFDEEEEDAEDGFVDDEDEEEDAEGFNGRRSTIRKRLARAKIRLAKRDEEMARLEKTARDAEARAAATTEAANAERIAAETARRAAEDEREAAATARANAEQSSMESAHAMAKSEARVGDLEQELERVSQEKTLAERRLAHLTESFHAKQSEYEAKMTHIDAQQVVSMGTVDRSELDRAKEELREMRDALQDAKREVERLKSSDATENAFAARASESVWKERAQAAMAAAAAAKEAYETEMNARAANGETSAVSASELTAARRRAEDAESSLADARRELAEFAERVHASSTSGGPGINPTGDASLAALSRRLAEAEATVLKKNAEIDSLTRRFTDLAWRSSLNDKNAGNNGQSGSSAKHAMASAVSGAETLAPLKRPLNRRLETILRHRRFLIGSYLAFLHLLAYEYLFVVPSTA
jgi:chromosome segregation ATPase